MKVAGFILLGLFIFLLLIPAIPILLGFASGGYNPITRLMYCNSVSDCLHEFAHHYDNTHGMISKTNEFRISADVYMNSNEWTQIYFNERDNENWYQGIYMRFAQNKYVEIYAVIFQYYSGNIELMPDYLQRYYK